MQKYQCPTCKSPLTKLRHDEILKVTEAQKERENLLALKEAAFRQKEREFELKSAKKDASHKAELARVRAAERVRAMEQARKELNELPDPGSPQNIGIAYDGELAAKLQGHFRTRARVTKKGQCGDVHLVPLVAGNELRDSLIVFECKRKRAITSTDIANARHARQKTNGAQENRVAFTVLVHTGKTYRQKPFAGFAHDGEVLIVNIATVVPFAELLHDFLVRLDRERLSGAERVHKSQELLEFAKSFEFQSASQEIINAANADNEAARKDEKYIINSCRKRLEKNGRILANALRIRDRVNVIIHGDDPQLSLASSNRKKLQSSPRRHLAIKRAESETIVERDRLKIVENRIAEWREALSKVR